MFYKKKKKKKTIIRAIKLKNIYIGRKIFFELHFGIKNIIGVRLCEKINQQIVPITHLFIHPYMHVRRCIYYELIENSCITTRQICRLITQLDFLLCLIDDLFFFYWTKVFKTKQISKIQFQRIIANFLKKKDKSIQIIGINV